MEYFNPKTTTKTTQKKRNGIERERKSTRTPDSFNTSYFVICTSWALSARKPRFYLAPKNHSIRWNMAFAWDALLFFIAEVGYDGGSQQNYDVAAAATAAVYFAPSLLRWNAICFSSIGNCSCAMHTQWTFWRVRRKNELNWIVQYEQQRGSVSFSLSFLPFLSFFLFFSLCVSAGSEQESKRERDGESKKELHLICASIYIHLYHPVKMSLLIHLDNDVDDDAFHRHTQTKFMLEIITHHAHVIIIQVNVLIKFFGVQTKCSMLWICVLAPFVFLDKLCLCARARAHAVDAKQQRQRQQKREQQQYSRRVCT